MDQIPYTVTDKRARARAWGEVKQDAIDRGLLSEERIAAAKAAMAVQEELPFDEEDRELLRRQAVNDDSTRDDNRERVLTAFVITMDYEGSVLATADLSLLDRVDPERPATFADMYSAAAQLQKDISTREAAMRMMQMLQQTAAASREMASAQKIAERIHIPR